MIEPEILPTARPGKPGLTFFYYVDLTVDQVDGLALKWRDEHAERAMAAMMMREHRGIQPGSTRRQYVVPLVRCVVPGYPYRPAGRDNPTHYRVIWFAEAVEI